MTMLETFLKPMHREGYKFVGIFAVITLVLFWIWDPLGWLGVGATVWCYYFFRDPKRSVPQGRGLIVSPADGVVSLIERGAAAGTGRGQRCADAGFGVHVGVQLPCEPRADCLTHRQNGLPPR